MVSNYLRIKLRKNQSTLPLEKLTKDIAHLEILGDSIESLPSLEKLINCKNLLIVCPALSEIKELPTGLNILKIKGGHVYPNQLPTGLETLQLSSIKNENSNHINIPAGVINLDLSSNGLTSLEGINLGAPLGRLNLDHNQLSKLPEELYENKSLLHLSLDGNPLSEEEKDKLFKAFGIWF